MLQIKIILFDCLATAIAIVALVILLVFAFAFSIWASFAPE
jgi:hypothetical protein